MATVLITGANRGIGLALCNQVRARGDQVIATCRHTSPELDKSGAKVITDIDMTSERSVQALASQVGARRIDTLILNAGVYHSGGGLENFRVDHIKNEFEVNALGPLMTVRALLPMLGQGSKVALITSRMGAIGDNTSGGAYGYRMSKAALNAAGVSLSLDLRERGIAVIILHPGWVQTDMTKGSGQITADESASGLLARIEELTLDTSGRFLHQNGQELPW